MAGGTETATSWSFAGSVDLPKSVRQEGSYLIINSTNRNQAGVYQCTVSNAVGMVTSVGTLTVLCEFVCVYVNSQ